MFGIDYKITTYIEPDKSRYVILLFWIRVALKVFFCLEIHFIEFSEALMEVTTKSEINNTSM